MGEVGVQTGLAEWLGQCIDEDERRIQATLARVRGWNRLNLPWLRAKRVDPEVRQPEEMLLAEWDPDRLLLECDTKRRIIEMHKPTEAFPPGEELTYPNAANLCQHCGPGDNWEAEQEPYGHYPCDHLRLMALPYRERDGYREEWKP